MPNTALSTLRERVRQRADMVRSQFVTDAELTGYINAAAFELDDILIASNEDYRTVSITIQITTSPIPISAISSSFYKIRGVDYSLGGEWLPIRAYNFQERGRYITSFRRPYVADVQYQLIGDQFYILPEDSAPGIYRIWYVPLLTELSADTDTLKGHNGWEEYVVTDAAIRCLQKEESDTTVLERQKLALTKRILEMSAARDQGEPERIADVRSSVNLYGDIY